MAQDNVSARGIFRSMDWLTILLYLIVVALGWLSVMGATYNFGDAITIDFATRAGKQLLWIGLALIWGFTLLLIDDKIYDTFSNILYIFMMAVLLVTPFIATDHKGSYSWIDIGSVSLQPAEFAKTATALALAKLMGTYGFSLARTRNFVMACAIIIIPAILIILQKETGSALVYLAFFLVLYREGMSGSVLFVGIAAAVYFIAGLRYNVFELAYTHTSLGTFIVLSLIWIFTISLDLVYDNDKTHAKKMFLYGLGALFLAFIASRFFYVFDISWVQLAVCIGCIAYLCTLAFRMRNTRLLLIAAFTAGSLTMHYSTDYVLNDILKPHQQTRIRVALGLEDDINGAGYNVRQSEIAIGSGGLTGKGFLNGTQTKLKYVPEQETDFIFCTVGEESGFVGSSIVLILFLFLILRLIHVAERQRFAMGRIYGYCVVSILLFHLTINIGMVMGLVPVIGIPLPFFSYGGSNLWGFTILLFIFLRIDAGRNRYN